VKYKQFVEALPPFVTEARTLLHKPKLHEDDQFRVWRHRLTDLLERVSEEGYTVNCKVATRSFDCRATYEYAPSNNERLAAYNRELQDTVVELETIMDHYATLDEPKRCFVGQFRSIAARYDLEPCSITLKGLPLGTGRGSASKVLE
jgi:hypothetical protein